MTGKPPVRIALFAALAALVLVLVPTAFAGKPGGHSGSGSGSINLVLLNSSDGLPHYGQQVTFSVSTSASQPWVDLECNQGSTWVYGSWAGFFPGYTWGQTFTLGPTNSWSGGAADCTARLVTFASNGKQNTLASTSFHVYA